MQRVGWIIRLGDYENPHQHIYITTYLLQLGVLDFGILGHVRIQQVTGEWSTWVVVKMNYC